MLDIKYLLSRTLPRMDCGSLFENGSHITVEQHTRYRSSVSSAVYCVLCMSRGLNCSLTAHELVFFVEFLIVPYRQDWGIWKGRALLNGSFFK